jgi:choline dehydrogenase-like flavoprotein
MSCCPQATRTAAGTRSIPNPSRVVDARPARPRHRQRAVTDASVVPSCIRVNAQLTTMAMAPNR